MTEQNAILIIADLYHSEDCSFVEREALGVVLYLAMCATNRTPEMNLLLLELESELERNL